MAVNESSVGSVKACGSLHAIHAGVNLRPDVVGRGSLGGCIMSLCWLLLCVGHDWAQDADVESPRTLFGHSDVLNEYSNRMET